MEPIKIPIGMPREDIPGFVRRRLYPGPALPPEPTMTRKPPKLRTNPPLEIRGDDWTTGTRGMRTGELRRLLKLVRDKNLRIQRK